MKTLCVMDSISRANGGIFEAERKLQQGLVAAPDLSVQVVGLRDTYTEADRAAWAPLSPVACEVRGPQAFGYAPELNDILLKADADLAYFVGLWKYPSLAALNWSRRTARPFLVSPHGMLDPWALQNSQMKKRIAGWLFQNEQLKKASCLRALCAAEAESIRAYGLRNPVCIVPNGVDLPTVSAESLPSPFPPGRKVLLYLGRLHPKKGLSDLLVAWKATEGLRSTEWSLAIAGWDQVGHEAELKRQATQLEIPWSEGNAEGASLLFLGPTFGDAKAAVYAHSDAFILPSLSEGLPMVVLEAWAYAKPVLMTPECNLPEGFAAQAALRIESGKGIGLGLHRLFEMSSDERQAMGQRGLALVNDRFLWPKITGEMRSVYDWTLGGGPKPECMSLT
jgi:glycosyltransferase involved in cell wall biosynthesis